MRRAAETPQTNIVAYAQLGKHLAALGHQDHALGDDPVCGQALQVFSSQVDAALYRPVQAGKRAHQARFARAVGAEHRDHFVLAYAQVYALQNRFRSVTRMQADHLEQAAAGCGAI